jgi:AcrR family transcriptional regulator
MPRIEAPTVVEHHQMRRAALLDAAGDLLATQGLEAVTLAAVGAAAGLARSSVYQYFDSTGSLLAALVEQEVPRGTEQLTAAMARAGGPVERVEAYVRGSIRAATDDRHRAMAQLASTDLPPQCRARVAELHQEQLAPLVQALAELGVRDPTIIAALVHGVVRAASTAINSGAPRSRVLAQALALVRHGVAAPSP